MKLKKYSPYIIAFCATIIRYYDYALFGLSASMISKNFMPGVEDGDQILVFFAIFSIAMVARPLGSIIFGKIGDKVSRVASVKISMVLAAVSTSLIAIIPSFESIGWFSVVLLTLCRMLFLVSLAGEIDAIKIYVAEKIGKKRRHLAIGIVSFSSQIGVLLASVMYHVAISFEEIQWLWKMNFFLGGLLGLFIIMMRGLLQESEAFLKSKSRAIEEADIGIVSIIGNNKMKFTLAVLINGMLGGGYHFLIIFLGTFAANVADVISPEQATSGNIKIIALYGIACVLSGYVSDRIHMTKQTVIALTCSISCVVMMEFMLNLCMFAVYLHYALAFIAPFYAVPCAIKMQSLFATGVRMRMFSLSHSLGSLIFSSTTPFMCMLIWRWSQSFPLVLGYFLIQLVVLFFALLAMARKDYINMFET
jgi:MFS family permease